MHDYRRARAIACQGNHRAVECDFGYDVVTAQPEAHRSIPEITAAHVSLEAVPRSARGYELGEDRVADSVEITAEGLRTIEQLASQQEIVQTTLMPPPSPALRTFATGATRHADTNKYDYEGFLSPVVLEAFAAYMHVNRRTVDGSLRDSDNWQKGIPVNEYMKSKWRHDVEMWKAHRGHDIEEGELAAACGVLFNTMGWIHEKAKADPEWFARELEKFKQYRAAEIASRK